MLLQPGDVGVPNCVRSGRQLAGETQSFCGTGLGGLLQGDKGIEEGFVPPQGQIAGSGMTGGVPGSILTSRNQAI